MNDWKIFIIFLMSLCVILAAAGIIGSIVLFTPLIGLTVVGIGLMVWVYWYGMRS